MIKKNQVPFAVKINGQGRLGRDAIDAGLTAQRGPTSAPAQGGHHHLRPCRSAAGRRLLPVDRLCPGKEYCRANSLPENFSPAHALNHNNRRKRVTAE
jgi:hypothetical protein